jgi:large subunit ribosomal protein L32
MPLPKKKQSKRRTRQRRSHHALEAPTVVLCSHCHQPMLPHRVCPNCGYYKGRQILKAAEV